MLLNAWEFGKIVIPSKSVGSRLLVFARVYVILEELLYVALFGFASVRVNKAFHN